MKIQRGGISSWHTRQRCDFHVPVLLHSQTRTVYIAPLPASKAICRLEVHFIFQTATNDYLDARSVQPGGARQVALDALRIQNNNVLTLLGSCSCPQARRARTLWILRCALPLSMATLRAAATFCTTSVRGAVRPTTWCSPTCCHPGRTLPSGKLGTRLIACTRCGMEGGVLEPQLYRLWTNLKPPL